MKASRVSLFMSVCGSFLFLYLPVISSTNTGTEVHSNDNQSPPSPKASQPGQPSPCQKTAVKDHSNAEQSSSLPRIPKPGQSFYYVKTQKDKNYVVVDKTDFITKLIDNDDLDDSPHKIYFLSRPKTFGKTFFLSMVHAFLDGKAELFTGTAIASRGNEIKEDGKWGQRPVIHIDFSDLTAKTVKYFESALQARINAIAEKYGISTKNRKSVIRWLIQALKSKFNFRVSILVDEFDFPVTLAPNELVLEGIKKVLKLFYSEIKAAAFASELWLVLIMGVNKLQVFSGTMNGLVRDITFNDKFSSIMGFLANETEKSFKSHLDKFAKESGWDNPDAAKKIENRYGGYRFSMKDKDARLLDAGSVCSCLREFEMADFETKTEALENIGKRMINERKGIDYFKYHCIKASELDEKYDTERKNAVPLYMEMLCQGYLTIKKYRPNSKEICLSYPNEGIEKRIERVLPVELRSRKVDESYRLPLKQLFQDALDESDMKTFVDLLIREALPIVSHSLQYKVSNKDKEFVATSYIFRALNILKLDCTEGDVLHRTKDGSDAGDLDLVIYAAEENMPHYAISNKFKGKKIKSPSQAIFQLFNYVVTKNVEFERMFDNKVETDVINLLGLLSQNDKERHKMISDWILVPYTRKDKKIWINKIKTSNEDLKLSFSKSLKDEPYFEGNKEKFVL